MDNIIELLTSKEVIVVYIVIAVACLLCFIIYLVDRNQDKRKRKQNTRELNKLVEDVNEAQAQLESQEALDQSTSLEDTSPVMVADGVDVVEEVEPTEELPIGPVHEEVQKFMPEPSDLQAYNNFSEELEDDGPIRENQPIVANTDIVSPTVNAPVENIPVPETEESNLVLNHMNEEVTGAAPAISIPEEDITISDKSLVPERERIEEIVYTDPEPTEEEATKELQKITEELERAARGETIEKSPFEPVEEPTQPVEQPVEEIPEEVVEEIEENPSTLENVEVATEVEEVPPVEEITPPVEEVVEEKVELPETIIEENSPAPINSSDMMSSSELPVADVSVPEEVSVTNNIDVAAYENEQEENAIISLEELTRKSEEMYAANEETQYADEGDEPISLEDLEKRKQKIVNSEINEEEQVSVEEAPVEETLEEVVETIESLDDTEQLSFEEDTKSSFHSSPVISPVFGFDRSDSISNKERIEQKKKVDAFLRDLKELQNRLNSK